MAKFKVGEKARVVYCRRPEPPDWRPGIIVEVIGLAGVDDKGKPYDYLVEYETPSSPEYEAADGCVLEDQLEKLVDDGLERFKKSLEKGDRSFKSIMFKYTKKEIYREKLVSIEG